MSPPSSPLCWGSWRLPLAFGPSSRWVACAALSASINMVRTRSPRRPLRRYACRSDGRIDASGPRPDKSRCMNPADPVAIARDLLRCPSVTPVEGGALSFLETTLKGAGFTVHRMTFSEPGTADVENLYARIGTSAPHLMFAGHTDVVPTGDEKQIGR